MRINQLSGRIAEHRRIELRIARSAYMRCPGVVVIHTDQAKIGEPVALIRIDQQQKRVKQGADAKERSAKDDDPPAPAAIGL